MRSASDHSAPSDLVFSRCAFDSTLNSILLSAWAGGTGPLTFQWFKNGAPLSDGVTASGSVVSGTGTFFLQVDNVSPADAGGYSCVVTGCGGASAASFAANVQADPTVPTASNDVCATALDVGEGVHTVSMCGAYQADGASSCILSGAPETADVFFRYTPTFTGNARFQTCGSFFDTTMQLMDQCNGAVLECNDDVGNRGLAGAFCWPNHAAIASFPVTAGVPIYVRVSTTSPYISPTGELTISQAPPRPVNDLCVDATPVGLGTYPFDLAEAGDDFTFGTDFCAGPDDFTTETNRDVWFRLDSPCGLGGTYTITTCGSNIFNPALHIMSDCAGTVVTCNDNSPPTAARPTHGVRLGCLT